MHCGNFDKYFMQLSNKKDNEKCVSNVEIVTKTVSLYLKLKNNNGKVFKT